MTMADQNNSYLVQAYDPTTGQHTVMDSTGNTTSVKGLSIQGRTPEQLVGKAVEISKMVAIVSEVKQARLLK